MSSKQFKLHFLRMFGFTKPIIIVDQKDMEMRMPSPLLGIHEICENIGLEVEVPVKDRTSNTLSLMSLQQWSVHFRNVSRTESYILSRVSLLNTQLGEAISPPQTIFELDWAPFVDAAAVDLFRTKGEQHQRPDTGWGGLTPEWMGSVPGVSSQKLSASAPQVAQGRSIHAKDARLFCDMQCSGTFSDFRICQSGASSWYYIHEGECWFYCIPPTTDSLSKFSEWFKAGGNFFFGDVVSQVSLFLKTHWQFHFTSTYL